MVRRNKENTGSKVRSGNVANGLIQPVGMNANLSEQK